MAPRKSSRRQKILQQNRRKASSDKQQQPLMASNFPQSNDLPSSATKTEDTNDANVGRDRQQHPPDCQCFLKRGGNLFLPPEYEQQQQSTDGISYSHIDNNSKA